MYPSSLHNRFVHSIGVYYLGELAVDGITKNNDTKAYINFENLSFTFKLACLLHDLGHSPFSHTGEKYYFYEKSISGTPIPWNELLLVLNDQDFKNDADNGIIGNEHEIMSALEAIKKFGHIIPEQNKAFFARCIIGLKYKTNHTLENCFINLLNSKTIDVDKLDYLLRDVYFTGFKSVAIDFERLLDSVSIIQKGQENYQLCFTKSGLSTLESVVLARDMEKKWIQNHPIIQYENYLLSSIINSVVADFKMMGINLFSLEALTEEGITGKEKIKGINNHGEEQEVTINKRIRLLSDSDILSYAKNSLCDKIAVKEYFSRSLRKKPLWKTEAEYKIYFESGDLGDSKSNELDEIINSLKKMLESSIGIFELPMINDSFIQYIQSELEKVSALDEDIGKSRKNNLDQTLKLVTEIKNYSTQNNLDFDYVLITSSQFSSSLAGDELKTTPLLFNNEIKELQQVCNVINEDKHRKSFFYIYTTENNLKKIDIKKFTKMIKVHIFKQE